MRANEFLESGLAHMQDRAATYDKSAGERSMEATVKAFRAVTGNGYITCEEQGWLFMVLLKLVRSQQGDFRADNYEDAAAYCGLQGEAAYKIRGAKNNVIKRDVEEGERVQEVRGKEGEDKVKSSGNPGGDRADNEEARGIENYLGPQTDEERAATSKRQSAYAEKSAAEARRKEELVRKDAPGPYVEREVPNERRG